MNTKKITVLEYEGDETIERERTLKCSALLPRLYRFRFGRDLIGDISALDKKYRKALASVGKKATEEEKRDAQMTVFDLTVFENLTWLMMKHAGEDVGESPDEWLDNVAGLFTVYEVMPVVLELWNASQITTAKPAEK